MYPSDRFGNLLEWKKKYINTTSFEKNWSSVYLELPEFQNLCYPNDKIVFPLPVQG